jgi:tripartite-type tricarboxylate transporter receptor subunit TctC
MQITRRTAGVWLVGAAGAGVARRAALASEWPTQLVRLVVPFPPGGGSDVLARLLADRLAAAWGQSVIVENRAGAGGAIGAGYVAKAPPDGYTLLLTDASAITTNPALYAQLPYAPPDFAPVINLAVFGLILVAPASSSFASVRDLLALDRTGSARINVASAGTGTTGHLALEKLKQMTGLNFTHVPYRGTGQAINDVVGGQVDVMLTGGGVAKPLLEAGRIKALGVTSARRLALVPDAPTFAEAGLAGYEWLASQALFAPSATPAGIVRRINADVAAAIASPELSARWQAMALEPVNNTPVQFAAWIAAQSAEMAALVRSANVKIE